MGPGSISWRDVQDWLDREGVVGNAERWMAERVLYAVDGAFLTETTKSMKSKNA